MAGIATFTIVVSSMIMKNPVVKTRSTSHGLVRARAMFPPQLFIVGIDTDVPLQPSVVDLFFQIGDPPALGIVHRDLVFELDQGEEVDTLSPNLCQDSVEFFGRGLQRIGRASCRERVWMWGGGGSR